MIAEVLAALAIGWACGFCTAVALHDRRRRVRQADLDQAFRVSFLNGALYSRRAGRAIVHEALAARGRH